MRLVLDVNVFVSGLISRAGAPARLLERWLEGEFELVVCEELLSELARTLRSPKLAQRVSEQEATEFLDLVRAVGNLVPDPEDPPPVRSSDPGDDYLVALAARERARIVSGDAHLLALRDRLPVLPPRELLDLLD